MRSLSIKTIASQVICSFFIALGAYLPVANAAEQVSFRISGAERSVAVADLRKLVNTGEQSEVVGGLFGTARIDPNMVRGYLGLTIDLKQYGLDIVVVDKFLNSYLMELLLEDLAKALRSPSAEGSVSAIKAAIIGSLADDNQISVIEFLEKYPTEMIIEVDRISRIQERISKDYANLAEPFARIMQGLQMRR